MVALGACAQGQACGRGGHLLCKRHPVRRAVHARGCDAVVIPSGPIQAAQYVVFEVAGAQGSYHVGALGIHPAAALAVVGGAGAPHSCGVADRLSNAIALNIIVLKAVEASGVCGRGSTRVGGKSAF